MRDSIQKAINRMSRATLGVLGSTPVASLETMGGSMPAEPRLQFRQACYAGPYGTRMVQTGAMYIDCT